MRVAVVTGAARNIGLAVAHELGAAGYAVGVNSRDPRAVDDACAVLRDAGVICAALPGDLRREDVVAELVHRCERELGPVDVLVNNAGVRAHAPIVDTALGDWQAVLDTVLTGSFLTTRAVLGGMMERGWGRVINVAGLSGQSGAAGRPAVVAAKSGIIGLTKATALEAAASGVTANAVSPGLIDTDRPPSIGSTDVADEFYRRASTTVPVGRRGTVEEVAGLCAYLASDRAGYITGQTFAVNGGAYL